MRSTTLPPVETGVVLTTFHWSSVRSIHHYRRRWRVTSGLNGSKDSFMLQAMARARIFGHRAGPPHAVVVELACRLARLSGRAVGTHDGGISASAVSNIRRPVRERQDGIRL